MRLTIQCLVALPSYRRARSDTKTIRKKRDTLGSRDEMLRRKSIGFFPVPRLPKIGAILGERATTRSNLGM